MQHCILLGQKAFEFVPLPKSVIIFRPKIIFLFLFFPENFKLLSKYFYSIEKTQFVSFTVTELMIVSKLTIFLLSSSIPCLLTAQ